MMAFVVHEAVWTLLYVVFIGVVVGELGGMFVGGIVMYCTLHYSRAPWRLPQKALASPLLSVRVFQQVGERNSPGVAMLSSLPASQYNCGNLFLCTWYVVFIFSSLEFRCLPIVE